MDLEKVFLVSGSSRRCKVDLKKVFMASGSSRRCTVDPEKVFMVSSCSSRCKLDLQNVLVTLEDQELKGKVELMKSLQDVILELQVSVAPSPR